jgi:hypothetical protein
MRIATPLPADLNPVGIRQRNIQDDHVRTMLPGHRHAFSGSGRQKDAGPGALELPLQACPGVGVAMDDQYQRITHQSTS